MRTRRVQRRSRISRRQRPKLSKERQEKIAGKIYKGTKTQIKRFGKEFKKASKQLEKFEEKLFESTSPMTIRKRREKIKLRPAKVGDVLVFNKKRYVVFNVRKKQISMIDKKGNIDYAYPIK